VPAPAALPRGALFGQRMRRFMDWLESVDHMVMPITLDIIIALLSAWLILSAARFLMALLFFAY
jgi:hypothetical protein